MKKLLLVLLIFISPELFAQGFWKKIGTMPYPVSGAVAVVHSPTGLEADAKIYIIGGYSDDLQSAVDWIQEFDPNVITNQWKMVGSMNQPRNLLIADVWKNFLLYFGGVDITSGDRNNLEFWNIGNDTTFTFDTKDNFGRSLATGHIKGDKFYIIGGSPIDPSHSLPFIDEYDLNTQQITYSLQSDEAPQYHMTSIVGDDIYIFGGVYNGIRSIIRKFNITDKTYGTLPEKLLERRAGGASVYNGILNKAFVLGGYNETNEALNTVEEIIYDNSKKKIVNISSTSSMLNARRSPIVVAVGRSIVVFGGRDQNKKVVPDVEIYIDTTTGVEDLQLPQGFKLYDNYPNPFNPSTTIEYAITSVQRRSNASQLHVSLKIYDMLGREIATLVNEHQLPGTYKVNFDVAQISNRRRNLPSGVYFYTLRVADSSLRSEFYETKKMVLLK
ncbi:MAG: T9SS type A sorting domain-containing protein [Ignavibacteriales bacterium]|nr:T9SS type A sorting domain-containing protein [Ignavibacteriales bacterium]